MVSLIFDIKAQSNTIPEVPLKTEFAHVQIVLNSDARELVNTEIRRLLTPQNSFLDKKIEDMQVYFPLIERILEVENVPDDFKYLAVLESSLNPDAVSSTKAVGYWQFKDFTAAEMGLVMDRNRDDRKNLHLSTKAAAQYLKKNNLIFKNWVSSALSYTVGAGGAASIVPVEWSFSGEVKFDKYTHEYLIRSLAHKIAFEHRLNRVPKTSKVLLEFPARSRTLGEISHEIGVSENELKKYNAWIPNGTVPGDRDYVLLVPSSGKEPVNILSKVQPGAVNLGYPKLKRITQVVTSTDQAVLYEINDKKGILAQPGDEVARLARKAKVSISKFLKYNDMTDRDLAKEGTVYYLKSKKSRAEVPYHTLGQNQSLWDVSHMYGVKLKKLKTYNRIKADEPILPGRVLWLQKKRPKKQAIQYVNPPTESPESTQPKANNLPTGTIKNNEDIITTVATTTHRVLENETLFSLAKKYNTTVEELRRLNNLKPSEGIQYNQRLIVPDSAIDDEPEDDWEETAVPPVKEAPKVVTTTKEPTYEPKTTYSSATGSHTVSAGETLFSIAKRYGITVDELRSLNGFSSSDILKSGQTILVSGTSKSSSSTKGTTSWGSHIVKKGETLFSISQYYEMSLAELRNLNGITGNNIMVGQRLKVSGTPEAVKTEYHLVKKGETLFSISQKYGVTVQQIRNWNNISGNNVVSGKRIIVNK